MNFRQNFSQKKKSFAISEKTLAETVHYIPKGLRKGNPFHGPFAQLSYMIYIAMVIYSMVEKHESALVLWTFADQVWIKFIQIPGSDSVWNLNSRVADVEASVGEEC